MCARVCSTLSERWVMLNFLVRAAAALARDKFRARLEEALGKACPEEEEEGGSEGGGGGKMVVEEQAATIEELRKALEAERHK